MVKLTEDVEWALEDLKLERTPEVLRCAEIASEWTDDLEISTRVRAFLQCVLATREEARQAERDRCLLAAQLKFHRSDICEAIRSGAPVTDPTDE